MIASLARWTIAYFLILAACDRPTPRGPLPLASVVLYEVHPLWGGEDIFLKSDGAVWIRELKAGPSGGYRERRFSGQLSSAEIQELEALLGQHDFPSIKIPQRSGIPDEAILRIDVRLKDGRVVSLSAFAQDVHEGFAPVRHWLEARAKRVDRSKPTYEGSSDDTWKPEGF
jgi:hypothetical protein